MNDIVVKIPGRLRPTIEQIAREEFIPIPDLVRSLVQKAIFQRQIEQTRQKKP